MDRFDVRVYPRRSGKTTKLQHLIEDEVAKGESKVIAMAMTHNCLKNLIGGISKEIRQSNKYSELSFRSIGSESLRFRLKGLQNTKIFFDEIYLLDDIELDNLVRLVEENRNIELISYTSYRQ